ncbi:UNVERIFIED_CONTAM: 3-phosphoshikimate 1-carboxyvinyltransferase, chloroplastic [Sesamum latifolium]|uniref:3-phosphoshikimate 1-carboxyvinyltransferase, chloroplastic n=1 Tax=Sesamum latifolium TaxID=2727402 RepID=A0AAW2U724_9LAMI
MFRCAHYIPFTCLQGKTVLDNLLDSDDNRYMLGALRTLWLNVDEDKSNQQAIVKSCGGLFPVSKESKDEIQLFLGNTGTAMRPLTAAVTAAGGNSSFVLDGVPRMRERPIGDLVTGLKQLGAEVHCFLGTNSPPVRVVGKGGLPRGKVVFHNLKSFIWPPLALGNMEIEIVDKLILVPYVEMTLKLMERFGVFVEHTDSWDRFLVRGGLLENAYVEGDAAYIEGDASSASYFLAGAAITGGTTAVEGCGASSLQLGATVEEWPDYCIITPPEKLNVTAIDTYDDRRMAVAFSLAACADVPVTIGDPQCTRRTFPNYLGVLATFSKH